MLLFLSNVYVMQLMIVGASHTHGVLLRSLLAIDMIRIAEDKTTVNVDEIEERVYWTCTGE